MNIILTGTIIPNATFVASNDFEQRRAEYLKSIKYYKQYGKVFFIENSDYDLSSDMEFEICNNFEWFKFPKSNYFEKGKGFQEFEMLDAFIKNDFKENDFVKVSGRYIIDNFDLIVEQIKNINLQHCKTIIDLSIRRKFATTYLFYSTKQFYLEYIYGLHKDMNDENNRWAEYVIYDRLKNEDNIRYFDVLPLHKTISGSDGRKYLANNFKTTIKILERKVMKFLNLKKLYL